jgi:hypothetical protein
MWPAQPRTFVIFFAPIVDPQPWAGFDVLAIFNDTFFMALMFLLSGLFVWPSLERKGGARFLRDRILRLGVPFCSRRGNPDAARLLSVLCGNWRRSGLPCLRSRLAIAWFLAQRSRLVHLAATRLRCCRSRGSRALAPLDCEYASPAASRRVCAIVFCRNQDCLHGGRSLIDCGGTRNLGRTSDQPRQPQRVESRGGISPPRAPRTVHEPLDSHSSRCSPLP